MVMVDLLESVVHHGGGWDEHVAVEGLDVDHAAGRNDGWFKGLAH